MVLSGLLRPVYVAAETLDENCVVSILNRTIQVTPGGGWSLPNIPSTLGRVRARATCVNEGITTSGQSDYFNIATNGITEVGEIKFGQLDPIPTALNVSAISTSLTSTGATTQLTVSAAYSDGTDKDVTQGVEGTNYSSSNSSIATVDSNGLVTAVSSGSVIIIARKDGALGVITIGVVTSGDSDGDGIPDDFERTNGLDPNDPFDAREDQDKDGLSALQEFQAGTEINIADTDGDGLNDGEELSLGEDGFVTDPLNPDTDGDGVSDGLEQQSGSNPTDPASFNLAAIIDTIDVTPTESFLIVNVVSNDDVIAQLKVLAHLTDGSTLDITSTGYGTNYSSSDLTICSFGAVPGQVFAGAQGNCTVTVTNSGFTETMSVNVSRFAPRALAYVHLPGVVYNVEVKDNYAFVMSGSAGMYVVDVSDRSAPSWVRTLDTPGSTREIDIVGNYAYIADGGGGLQIVDISDPLAPIIVGTYDTPNSAQDVVVRGSLAYIADHSGGLKIVNVSVPSNPLLVGEVIFPSAFGVDLNESGTLAVVAASSSYLTIDVSNPANPVVLATRGIGNNNLKAAINGNMAYLTRTSAGLTPVDITNPASPIQYPPVSNITGGYLQDVVIHDGFAFGADGFFVNGVPIIDVSNPPTAVPRVILDFSQYRDDNGKGIAVDDEFVYLAANKGSGRLYIGQYRAFQDTDGDGLSDAQEIALGTNPNNADTDGDGIQDKAEVDNGLNPLDATDAAQDLDNDGLSNVDEINAGSDIRVIDTDGDGLTDAEEVNSYGTNPASTDSDNDGLSDSFEISNGLDPLVAVFDVDGDGVSNSDELVAGTNPLNSDSDSDGLTDGEEINTHNTDPLVADTDGDGLLDGQEINDFGMDPLKVDSDNDGLLDAWEVQYFGNGLANPGDDLDGDGLLNIIEQQEGTDPTQATIPTRVEVISANAGEDRNSVGWENVGTAISYNIYWSLVPGVTTQNGTKVTNVANPFVHTGLSNGTPYYYVVTGVNTFAESAPSTEVTATPGQGRKWSPPYPISDLDTRAEHPAIAYSNNGTGIAAWRQDVKYVDADGITRTKFEMRASRYTPSAGWSIHYIVSGSIEATVDMFRDNSPEVKMDGKGNAIVIWRGYGDVSSVYPSLRKVRLFATRFDTNSGWEQPIAISMDEELVLPPSGYCRRTDSCATSVQFPSLEINRKGEAIAVWQHSYNQGGNKLLSINSNRYIPGVGWQGQSLVSQTDTIAFDAKASIDGDGNITVIWQTGTDNPYRENIYARRYERSSGWEDSPTLLFEYTFLVREALRISSSNNGHTIVFYPNKWTDSSFKMNSVAYRPGLGWGPQQIALMDGRINPYTANIAIGDSGEAFAVYIDSTQRYEATTKAARFDPVSGWGIPVGIDSNGQRDRYRDYPQVGIDAGGNATVTWQEREIIQLNYKTATNRYIQGIGWSTSNYIDNYFIHGSYDYPPQLAINDLGDGLAISINWLPNMQASPWVYKFSLDYQLPGSPVADAGPDRVESEATTILFDGTGSSDSDGALQKYYWVREIADQNCYGCVEVSGQGTPIYEMRLPDLPAGAPDLSFSMLLTVVDNNGRSSSDVTSITILSINAPPVANAGSDRTVNEGTRVNLWGGSSSDAEGPIANYLWTQISGPTVTIVGSTIVNPYFVAPTVDADSVVVLELTVTDSGGKTATDQVAITVINSDSDNDGLLDSWEIQYFGDLSQDGAGDFDGDGLTNQTEYLTNGDPTVPALPQRVYSISGYAGSSQNVIEWNPVSVATSYNLYWSTSPNPTVATAAKIATATSPYVHTGLTNGTTYYYFVTSQNSAGESQPSDIIDLTPRSATNWSPPFLLTDVGPSEGVIGAEPYKYEIRTSRNGNAVAVWTLAEDRDVFLGANYYTPSTGWGEPFPLALNGEGSTQGEGHAIDFDVAIDENGNATAVWTFNSGTIYASHYTNGAGWSNDMSTPQIVSETLNSNYSEAERGILKVAMNSSGNALVAWGMNDDMWALQYDAAVGWGQALPLGASGMPYSVALDLSDNHQGVIVWPQRDIDSNWEIVATIYELEIGWGPVTEISTGSQPVTDGAPSVSMDAVGNSIAVWTQSDGTIDNVWSNRFQHGLGWGVAEVIGTPGSGSLGDYGSEVGSSFVTMSASYPVVKVAPSGAAITVWKQGINVRDEANYETWPIWARFYDPVAGWIGSTPILLSEVKSFTHSHTNRPHVDINSLGSVAVAWPERDVPYGETYTQYWLPIFDQDILARQYSAINGWSAINRLEYSIENVSNPKISIDDSSIAHVIWYQRDSSITSNSYLGSIWASKSTLLYDPVE